MLRICILFIFLFSPLAASAQATVDTTAKQAIIVDYDTGTVLFEKNADERMPTSSMSKVMTMMVVFEALKKGEIKLDDSLPVSEKAWQMQGSKMFVELGNQIKVEDLLRGVIVQSGNDATIVLAEGVKGSEGAFVDAMNVLAKDLGMKDSHFMNASGWPDPEHYSTARDLAKLGQALIQKYPEYYKYYSEKEFAYHNITQQNRNPLLYKNIGGDGIKTGHTEAAGYGLIGSGKQNDRRVILVVNGLIDQKARADEASALLEWALTRFKNQKIFKQGDIVESALLAYGQEDFVPMVVKKDVLVTLPTANPKAVKVSVEYKEPLTAPIKKDQEVGTLIVQPATGSTMKIPLYAAADIARNNIFGIAFERVQRILGKD